MSFTVSELPMDSVPELDTLAVNTLAVDGSVSAPAPNESREAQQELEDKEENIQRIRAAREAQEIQSCSTPRVEVFEEAVPRDEPSLDYLSVTSRVYQTQFAPKNALHFATSTTTPDFKCCFRWESGLPLERRATLAFPAELSRIVESKDSETVIIRARHLVELMECVRLGLKANSIFRVDKTPVHEFYMIENEPNMLLGINGEIGCGKSTVVEYISRKYKFVEYMFAQPLKEVAMCLGFTYDQVYGTQEQKLEVNEFWGITGRNFLQVFGSEVCRDYVPKVLPQMRFNGLTMWVRLFEKYLAEHPNINVAVSDVRFQDESQTIKKYNGIVARIVRPNRVASPAAVQTHKSETQANVIKPNVIINNDRDLETLYKKLDLMVDFIQRGIITASTLELTI